jgi:hypothetical protein
MLSRVEMGTLGQAVRIQDHSAQGQGLGRKVYTWVAQKTLAGASKKVLVCE